MVRKWTVEKSKELFTNKGYNPLFDSVNSVDSKLSCMDNDGYKYAISISNLKKNVKPNKFYQTNPFVIENIKKWIKDNNTNLILISTEYEKATKPLKWICSSCNDVFETTWSMVYSAKKFICNNCSQMQSSEKQKHSFEYVKTYIQNNTNLTLLDNRYKNAKTPLNLQCICGNKFKTTFLMIKTANVTTCKSCSFNKLREDRKFSYEQVKQYISKNDCTLISKEYNNQYDKLDIQCKCGNIFKTTFETFKNRNKTKCDVCSNKIKWNIDKINSYINQNSKCLLLSRTYVNRNERLLFKCSCGEFFKRNWNSFLSGATTCSKCTSKQNSERQRLEYEKVESYIESCDCKLLSTDYRKNTQKLDIQCVCGEIFKVSFNKFKNNNQIRCRNCTKTISKGELKIRNYLKSKNIPFKTEFTFNDLRGENKQYLKFDFYLPTFNICIEYDGELHYIKTSLNNDLESQKFRDNLKNNYCHINKIKLIRIPYWDFNNIEIILDNTL